MKTARLENMTEGWFVGSFSPTLCQTHEVEVAVKTYRAGESEGAHFHKIATELTVVTQGEIEMNGIRYVPGDIVIVEPGEVTTFRAISDAMTTVVKLPGASNDKYTV